MTHDLAIRLFGGVEIVLDGAPLGPFISAKGPALLAYLAVTGRPHRREALAGLLWGELSDAAAANNLRQVLTSLRKALEPFLLVTRETVELNPARHYRLDVAEFTALLAPAADLAPAERARRQQTAADLYRGDFLAGFYVRDAPDFEEWMLAQRARYRELALNALHALTQRHLEAGEYDVAIHDATALLALEPWREETHGQLMLALARTGQRSAALAQYGRCRRLLAEELGVEPSAETTALYERIKASLRGPRHNLPAATTGFVGREGEMAALRRLLAPGGSARLVTIVGPGGVGKTRLALEAARLCEPIFLHGAWFVPLVPRDGPAEAKARHADALALALADALGCPLVGPADPKSQVRAFLHERELLLVVDNLEEWREALPWLCELLAAAPGVSLLVAVRERLNVQAEQLFPLDGLPVPSPGSADPAASPAVQLFVQRAQRVLPDFAPTVEDYAAAARIARAVQGLPLGIELAAAWADQLSCAEIAAEIEQGLDFLATARHDVPLRQRSLRAVFDWAWGRLAPDEQAVFRRLTVFRGPFSREAAVRVAGASLPILAALADKSLVWRRGTTYQLHEVARRFAGEKLAQVGETKATLARHAAYYAEFLAQRGDRLKRQDQGAALAEIEGEIEDMRAAWQWLVAARNVAGLAAATDGLYHFYLLRSRFAEGWDAFRAARLALEKAAPADRPTRLAHGRLAAREARFLSALAQYEPAQRLLAANLDELRTLDAPAEVAFVLSHMGGTARLQGDLDTAERWLCECLALRRQLDDRAGQAIALLELAGVAFMREDYEAARRHCEEGLAVGDDGDLQTTAHLLTGLSLCLRELGQHAQAETHVRRSLGAYEALGDRYGVLQACLTLGELNRQLGDHTAARAFCERAVAIGQAIGDRSGEADGYYRLGQIAADLGEREAALRRLRLALSLAHEIGETLLLLDILLEIACLLAAPAPPRDAERAATILAFLLAHPQLPDRRRVRAATTQAVLPPNVVETLRATSRQHGNTLSEVMALAMAS